jgi:uncharacterized membrane protein
MITWELQPIFDSYGLVLALAGLALWTLWAIRLDRQLSLGRRLMLTGMRLLTLAVLLVLCLRPAVSWTGQQAMRQAVAVMVDTSSSMELPSGREKLSRYQVERQTLSDLQKQARALGKDIEWRLYGYDNQLRELGWREDEAAAGSEEKLWTDWMPGQPQGVTTEVGQTLARVLASANDPPLMAIVWLGDGIQTTRGDTFDAQQVARQLATLDIPLFLVGIGPRSGAEESRDQILEGVPDQSEAFTGNRVPLRGSLRAIGLTNRELKVAVFLRQPGEAYEQLGQVNLKPNQSDQTLPFELSILAPAPGAYQLLIKAEAVEGEATLLNNEQVTFLNVRDSGSRILFLEGQPRQEQKFIRQALADSPDLQVDWRFFPETARSQWPIELDEELAANLFDCIILGDLDAAAIGPNSWKRLVELVEQGVGLVMLGGYHAYGSGGYEATPLAEILPVELDRSVRQYFEQPIQERGHWSGELPLKPRGPHPITDLAASDGGLPTPADSEQGEAANLRIWSQLKPLLGANRWKGVKPNPGVQILAVGSDDQPLIVSSDAGKGRILCLAFDSSYRWWRQGMSDRHRQFWRQSILWTMRREEVREGLRLTMPKRSFSLGEATNYQLIWNPGSLKKPLPRQLDVRWWLDGEDRGPLLPQPLNSTELEGQLGPFTKPGRYEIVAKAAGEDGQAIESRLPFVVIDLAIEKIQATPDWQLISQLSSLNESAGGRIVAPEASGDILKVLQQRRLETQVDTVRTYRLGESVWDSWLVFLTIATLFSIQWALRKAWNLP